MRAKKGSQLLEFIITRPLRKKAIDDITDGLQYNSDGIISAISQQHDTGEVFIVAWMSKEAVEETLHTGRVLYRSRSRKKLWRKGEISGQAQTLKEFRWDCEKDTILLQVHQDGVAWQTGRRNCFYLAARNGNIQENADVIIDWHEFYG